MSLADDLRDLVGTYRAALLLADAPAIDYSRDIISQGSGGHGSHKARTSPSYGAEKPLAVELEDAFARFVVVWRNRLAAAQSGAPAVAAKGDRVSSTRRAERKAVLSATGQPAIEVAYVYGWTEDGVRRARLAAGLDPATGERVDRERPITAPPAAQLDSIDHGKDPA